jgi:hypothetical protein
VTPRDSYRGIPFPVIGGRPTAGEMLHDHGTFGGQGPGVRPVSNGSVTEDVL